MYNKNQVCIIHKQLGKSMALNRGPKKPNSPIQPDDDDGAGEGSGEGTGTAGGVGVGPVGGSGASPGSGSEQGFGEGAEGSEADGYDSEDEGDVTSANPTSTGDSSNPFNPSSSSQSNDGQTLNENYGTGADSSDPYAKETAAWAALRARDSQQLGETFNHYIGSTVALVEAYGEDLLDDVGANKLTNVVTLSVDGSVSALAKAYAAAAANLTIPPSDSSSVVTDEPGTDLSSKVTGISQESRTPAESGLLSSGPLPSDLESASSSSSGLSRGLETDGNFLGDSITGSPKGPLPRPGASSDPWADSFPSKAAAESLQVQASLGFRGPVPTNGATGRATVSKAVVTSVVANIGELRVWDLIPRTLHWIPVIAPNGANAQGSDMGFLAFAEDEDGILQAIPIVVDVKSSQAGTVRTGAIKPEWDQYFRQRLQDGRVQLSDPEHIEAVERMLNSEFDVVFVTANVDFSAQGQGRVTVDEMKLPLYARDVDSENYQEGDATEFEEKPNNSEFGSIEGANLTSEEYGSIELLSGSSTTTSPASALGTADQLLVDLTSNFNAAFNALAVIAIAEDVLNADPRERTSVLAYDSIFFGLTLGLAIISPPELVLTLLLTSIAASMSSPYSSSVNQI